VRGVKLGVIPDPSMPDPAKVPAHRSPRPVKSGVNAAPTEAVYATAATT
jgi:hypothetical protein